MTTLPRYTPTSTKSSRKPLYVSSPTSQVQVQAQRTPASRRSLSGSTRSRRSLLNGIDGRRSNKNPTISVPPLRPIVLYPARIVVLLVVLHAEYGVFYFSTTFACHFNHSPSAASTSATTANGDAKSGLVWKLNTAPQARADAATEPASRSPSIGDWVEDDRWTGKSPVNLLIVSDPQILDMKSYPGRNVLLRYLGVKFTDQYIKKAWSFVRQSSSFKLGGGEKDGVDTTIWLGDLMDSGAMNENQVEFKRYANRFFNLFPTPKRSTTLPPEIPSTIYIPGNHDLGLHVPSSSGSKSPAQFNRERFVSTFGPTLGNVQLPGGWDLVWVDSMALLEEGPEGLEARRRVEELGPSPINSPRILFTHIPLFRPEGTFCGAEREHSNPLHQGAGLNYQNELDEATTQWLVRTLKPNLVYSGDDHDSCIVRHPFLIDEETPLVETTVKAFSMAMGVKRPGYHLLSLYPPLDPAHPSTSATFTQTNCLLPDQIHLWTHFYLELYIAGMISLIVFPWFWGVVHKIIMDWRGDGGRGGRGLARSNGLPIYYHQKKGEKKTHRHGKSNSFSLTSFIGGALKSGNLQNKHEDMRGDEDGLMMYGDDVNDYSIEDVGIYNTFAYSGSDLEGHDGGHERGNGHSRRSSLIDQLDDEDEDNDDQEDDGEEEDEDEEKMDVEANPSRGGSTFRRGSKLFTMSGKEKEGRTRRLLTKGKTTKHPLIKKLVKAINSTRLGSILFSKTPFFKTLVKSLRFIWRYAGLVPDVLQRWAWKFNLGKAVLIGFHRMNSIIGPGVGLWVAIWVWFAL